jgi:hypothetical protein
MPKLRLTLALAALPVVALAFNSPDGVSAQAEKDKDKKKGTKVYTDEDLKNAKGNVTVLKASPDPKATPDPNAAAGQGAQGEAGHESAGSAGEGGGEGRTGSGAETGSTTSSGDANRDESSWRDLARQRWQTLRDAEASIARIQSEIDDLVLDRNPNPPDLLDPDRLQKREARKVQLMEQLEAARQNLVMAQEALDELRRRANLAHVPPSWLDEPPRP